MRDIRVGWQQILTLIGIDSIPEEEWELICMDYQLSWDRNLGNTAGVGAVARKGPGPSPVKKHRNSTGRGRAVAASHVKRRKTSPSPSTPVASPFKRRNSTGRGRAVAASHVKRRQTSPSPSTPVASRLKRCHSMVSLSTPTRRNSMASPSTPVASPFKRRNSIASPSTPTRRNSMASPSTPTRRNSMAPPSTRTPRPISKGKAWSPSYLFRTNKLMNSLAAHGLKDFTDFMPFIPNSPISPIKRRDSVALDQEMTLKKSGSSVTPRAPKRRNSSVSASAEVKSKQKPISIVKHVTESGDELDDDQMLVTWKDYGKQQRALNAKSLGSPKKESPKKKPPRNIGGPRKCPGPSPVMKHRNSTSPGGAVASSQVKRRKTSPSPSPSTPVASRLKRCHSMVSLSTPTRRNSMARPFSKGQAWDSSFCTPKLRNSVAAHRPKEDKQGESPFEFVDFKDFMPLTPISPVSTIKRRDSLALNQEMNLKKSGSSVTPRAPKRRNSSVSTSAKVKSKQKPISIVKHVTASGDELDDDQMLVTWKDYGKQQRALNAKFLGSSKKESPPKKPPGDIGVNPPVKRKRGRPTREEKARRLEEEQALKMMNQTSNQFKLPPKMQSNPVGIE